MLISPPTISGPEHAAESFDWKLQASTEPKVIKESATGRFITHGENVLLLGPPGVGETHLRVALGTNAYPLELQTMFTTTAALITILRKPFYEHRLDKRPKLLTQPKLLIINKIGYIPIDGDAANLFFHLITRCYKRASVLITSNQSVGAWGV